jgi:hypothetical protein
MTAPVCYLSCLCLLQLCSVANAQNEPAYDWMHKQAGGERQSSGANLVGSFGYEHGPGFRGTRATSTNGAFLFALEYSHLGFSTGMVESLAQDADSSQTELFVAYSYPLGWVDLSGGVQTFIEFDTDHRDSLEMFFEARTEPIYGFNFYLGQFLEPTHGFHSYTEFKVSRRYGPTSRKIGVEPYALISFGNYYKNDFTLNHAQFGVDTEYKINDRLVIAVYGAAVLPLEGVKMFTGSDDLQGLVGFRISYQWENTR